MSESVITKEMVDTVDEETLSNRIDMVEDAVRSVKVIMCWTLFCKLGCYN